MRTSIIVLLLSGTAMAKFRVQEIDHSLTIGYAVSLVDINADGKPDIVVVDKDRVIWFENPTWKLRTITQGKTALDNVCIAPMDIDGDGKVDLALGAGWKFGDTKTPSTLQWLRRGRTLDEPWEIFPIKYEEPTLHRMRWMHLHGADNCLVTVPLLGRGSTKEKNWSEAGVKIEVRTIPTDPTTPLWPVESFQTELHVAHNFCGIDDSELLVASYEGINEIVNGKIKRHVSISDQSNTDAARGASEIRIGFIGKRLTYLAAIEPFHGNHVVVYTQTAPAEDFTRHVIDDHLTWGHALACADIDVDGDDELIVGIRDSGPGDAKSGVRIYDPPNWTKQELDPGGVAVEDLAVADLNGDGKPDIVACGRATKNVRVYWNEGP
jgi:hypothetical protein